ncbi:2-keto-3-deoxygluconate kinase [Lysinibacillus sp. 2017]|uniref:2-keto-3-deoxygluconate kinase n=1 Tax=unclassified Lysinibacillus TaxID=2636778 RepID=UPI000D52777F|nr:MULTISPECIES: 2-keto-3-deoxygluconate kinase [unclassified Lysinibacillus]AWE09051.1 2-keto-3-deoxygluconate kinase [Lysinibacillus sp. 2017]TGN35875.1 2-keto-3-deoxygluconate kinase [Lysinibacillus sp. S2017]
MREEGRDRHHEKDGEHGEHRRRGAQTFRRGRALEFYRQLVTKRDTLKKQLESSELQSIHPVIAGELKATEAIMDEFVVLFRLDELVEEPEKEAE